MPSGGFHSDAKFKGLYANKKPSIQVTITASIDSYELHDSLCDVLRIVTILNHACLYVSSGPQASWTWRQQSSLLFLSADSLSPGERSVATKVAEVAADTRRRGQIYSEGISQRGRPERDSIGLSMRDTQPHY